MVFDAKVLNMVFQAFSFISVFAAIIAGIIMFYVRRKFGTGILAKGFKNISVGVLLIAFGILFDVFLEYLRQAIGGSLIVILELVRGLAFLTGTYVIVIAGKKMADSLESLLK